MTESPISTDDPDVPEDEDDEDGGPLLNRRALLAGSAFGIGAGIGAGTTAYFLRNGDLLDGEEPVGTVQGVQPEDHVPFSVWEELREGLRTSPDHLPGRAESLVGRGDLEAIYEFVRDEIVTVPTGIDDTRETESGTRWGVRGTLRSGMGTPRDKADVLAELYRRAGYEATVVSVDDGFSEDDVRDHYSRPVERVFDPDVGEGTLADWYDRLDADPPEDGSFTILDEDGAESTALAERLRVAGLDPTDVRGGPEAFSWEWGSRGRNTPVVAVTVDGGVQYANLFGDVPFGEAGGDVDDVRERNDPETVSVSLSAVTPRTRDEPIELVSGEWPVPELIGRQLLVRTPPIVELHQHPTAILGDIDTFTPSLLLQGLDLSREEALEASVIGDPFSLRGDRLSATDDGIISRNGEPFYAPDSDVEPTDVVSLEIEADPVDYPTIGLEVTATDEDDVHVEGLPASAFAVTDADEDVVPTMTETTAQAHVMYIRDDSGSMDRGVDGATDDEWFDDLRVVIAGHDVATTVEYRTADSDMWTHLTDAVADGPDLIVYAHDGDETDEYVETMDTILEEAPPTVLLSAYDEASPVEDETVLEQAALTGATTAPMGEWDTVREAVTDALDGLDLPTYRFDYHVPDREEGEREVEITVGDDDAVASTTYEPTARNPIPRALIGLYLTVETGGKEVMRTLGGWDPELDGEWDPYRDEPETAIGADIAGEAQAHARDVHSAVLGEVTMSFEGDGVPFSVAVDDVLGARNTLADLDLAATTGDVDELEAAMEAGGMMIPHELLLAQSPLPDATGGDGVTFFRHARVALAQQKVRLGTDELEQSLDVLPLTQAATTIEDPEERFMTTLDRTARISVVEGRAYDVSAASLLEGTELVELGEFDADHDHRAGYTDLASRAGFTSGDHQLVPADGSAFALWNIDAGTGTLTGVIDDATGGARRARRLEERLDELDQAVSVLNLYLQALSAGGAVGILVIYFQQLARMYAGVVLTLTMVEPRMIDVHLREAAAGMVCGLIWDITFGIFGIFGEMATLIDNLLGAAGVSTPTSC